MAGTKFSDYLGVKHYKKAKKIKNFNNLGLANWPQSFSTYHYFIGILFVYVFHKWPWLFLCVPSISPEVPTLPIALS